MKLKTKKILLILSSTLVFSIDLICAFMIYCGFISLESFNSDILISNDSQIIILTICALLNLISIFLISKDLLKHKKKIIILNVIQFLLGNLLNIVSGIFNIILVSTKTKGVVYPDKVKKELPNLEDITKHKWYIYFFIFAFLFAICYTPLTNLILQPNNKITALVYIVLLYIIQILFLIIPMCNELKRDFIIFKDNFKLYLSNMLPRFGIILIAYMIANFSLITLVSSIPANQSIISSWPIYISAPVAIIIAPLTEELMFRGFMKKFIKNNILFLILSSLIFGGLHVTVATSLPQLLFIIPYSLLGFAFALNYTKTKNIVSNIFLHSAWNSIAVIALIITNLL